MSRINRNRSVTHQVELGIAGQTLRVGFAHRHTLVDIDVQEGEFDVYDQAGELLATFPRTSGKEVTRTKGYGVRDSFGWKPSPVPMPPRSHETVAEG